MPAVQPTNPALVKVELSKTCWDNITASRVARMDTKKYSVSVPAAIAVEAERLQATNSSPEDLWDLESTTRTMEAASAMMLMEDAAMAT